MKHSIRQRVLDPVTGLMVTKVETVNGELGSGIFDKNGKEIFEGDIVKINGEEYLVDVSVEYLQFDEDGRCQVIPAAAKNMEGLEVIGHVGD